MTDHPERIEPRHVHNGLIAIMARVQMLRRHVSLGRTLDPVRLDEDLEKIQELLRAVDLAYSIVDRDQTPCSSRN